MSNLSRRNLVASGLAATGAAVLPSLLQQANAGPAVATRFNLATPNGQAMLKKYAQAVKIMKATPPGDPLSWTFQSYTHWVPGATLAPTFKTNAINTIYPAGSNPQHKALAQQMWDTCQPHGPGMVEDYFLPWHRMYVCFFENVIRKVLNDNTFTLPYWNYSVPAGYPLPKEFRMPNDPVFGSLFEPKRRAAVNNGQPIYTGAGVASDLSPAGDPIFWMHHCNIDRLWVSWNNANHSNPATAAWLNKTFVFAGQNGQPVTAIVKDYSTTAKCGYRYDQLAPAPLVVATTAMLGAVAEPLTVAVMPAADAVALGAAPVRVNLRPTTAALSTRLESLSENRRLYLILRNLSAATTPEAIYRVYLDLPEGVPDDPLNSHYAGSFNFFDAAGHEEHAAHASKPYSYDITTVVANLQARGVLKPEHTVTIVPSGQPSAEAKPVVGEISIVEQ